MHLFIAEIAKFSYILGYMELDNLTQYDKRSFKKLLGLYAQETRLAYGWTLEETAERLKLPVAELKQIEAGQKTLSQTAFDYLRLSLNLDEQDLINIGRITQVQNLMDVYREINAQFPK